jgi:Transposase DDE domain
MLLSRVFEPFLKTRPICVMARCALERLLDADHLNDLFEKTAETQYTKELLFSTLVQLMSEVVLGKQPSVHAAYQSQADDIPVSVTAVYRKLDRMELGVSEALVRDSFERAEPVIRKLHATEASWLPGYNVKILDGLHLGGSEHRIEELRHTWAAPLPGKALVVFDQAKRLVRDVFLTEDGQAQERSLIGRVLETVERGDLWIADRNFCTLSLLFDMHRRQALFVLRQHGCLKGCLLGRRRRIGKIETGIVYEQALAVTDPESGEELILRRVTVELNQPTREGDTEIHILSNVPAEVASSEKLAELYRNRWTIERVFFEIERAFESEISTLGYPGAALFALSLGLLAYNAVALIEAAIACEHGREKVRNEVSMYYLSLEIRQAWDGMQIAIPPQHWRVFATQSDEDFAASLREIARRMQLARYQKHPRGPKKKPPKKTKYEHGGHVSTAKLIAERTPR